MKLKEKPNLYSQFPMYMNIEPDGNANLVVFYNSNPSGKKSPPLFGSKAIFSFLEEHAVKKITAANK